MAIEPEISQDRLQYLLNRLDQYENAHDNGKGVMVLSNGDMVINSTCKAEMQQLKKSMQILKKAAIVETLKETFENNQKKDKYLQEEREFITSQIEKISKEMEKMPSLSQNKKPILKHYKDKLQELENVYENPNLFAEHIVGEKSGIDDLIGYTYSYFNKEYEQGTSLLGENYAKNTTFDNYGRKPIYSEEEIDLAMEILNGDRENYETLLTIKAREHEIDRLPAERRITNEVLQLTTLVNAAKQQKDKLQLLDEEISSKEKEYDSYGILKIFHKDLNSEISNLKYSYSDMSTRNRSTDSSIYDMLEPMKKYTSNETQERLKNAFRQDGRGINIEDYSIIETVCREYKTNIINETNVRRQQLNENLEALNKELPDKYKNVNPDLFERMTYYGRGRIGNKEDYQFDNTRYCLQVVSTLNQLKKNINVRDQILSEKEVATLQNIANREVKTLGVVRPHEYNDANQEQIVDTILDRMVNGTIDINGNPIQPNSNENTNTRSMGYSNVPILGLISIVATAVMLVIGLLIIK